MGPSAEVGGSVLRSDPSSSIPVNVPSSVEVKDIGIAEDGYKTGSNIDLEEVRMLSEGFTRVEVRLEGSNNTMRSPWIAT